MAVKIRLTRTGANKDNCFRIVAADTRFPRDGRFIELLGWYDPKKTGVNFGLKRDRIDYWKSVGAIVSETVVSLIRRAEKADKAAAEQK
jgi:small subunit ribosomal protein S16